MSTPRLPERFTDVTWLGAGAMGEVYAARLGDVPVAVKILAAALADRPEAAWAFAAEHRRLARLAHPAFPALLEEGRTADLRPYYAMERVAAEALAGPLPAPAVRRILAAVAAGLAVLHGAGLVHGDVKAENVRARLVAGEGHVLLDLGLAMPIGQRRGAIAGTPTHMAPEVLYRAPVAPPADLYALGVLGYELWAGRPPFEGPLAALLRGHLTERPPALAALGADVAADPELVALLGALLAKDAADRPPSAEAVHAALTGAPAPVARPGLRAADGSWVGRAAVDDRWRACLAGVGAPVLGLAGGPGLGKTRALVACRLAAQLAGRTWAEAAGAPGAAPGETARALLGGVLGGDQPAGTLATWLAGRPVDAWRDLEPAAAAAALAAAAGDALRAAAARTPLALGLDDAHLADEASAALFARLAAALPATDVAWAIARDPGAAPPAAADLVLEPLDDTDAAALVADRLGDVPPPALLALIGPLAAGRPALLAVLLEQLVAAGALVAAAADAPSRWAFDAAAAREIRLPASMAGLWQDRLAALPPGAARLAAVLAIAPEAGELPAAVVAAAASDPGPAAWDALLAAGVATGGAGAVRLAVPALAPACAGLLDPGEAAAMAAAMARALAPADPADPAAAVAVARAAALALAGDDPALAAPLAAAAGGHALAQGAPAVALRWLDAAAARATDGLPGLDLARAEALRLLDRLPEAAAAYEAMIAAVPAAEPRTLGRAWNGLARVRQMGGDYPGALAAYAGAAAAGDPVQQARALAGEARARAFRGEVAAGLAVAIEAAARAAAADAPAVRAQALALQGYLIAYGAPARVAEADALLAEAVATAEALGDRAGLVMALDLRGNVGLAAGDLAGAGAAFGRAADLARDAGLSTEALGADLNVALVAAERGERGRALARAAAVVERALAGGRRFIAGAARTAEARARAQGGDAAGAAAALDDALAIAAAIANALLEEHALLARAELGAAAGDPAAVAADVARARVLVEASGHAEARDRLALVEATLAWRAGDAAEAVAIATPLALGPQQVVAFRASLLLAALAVAGDAGPAATAHAERALAIATGWQAPWHVAAAEAMLAQANPQAGHAAAAPPTDMAPAGAGVVPPGRFAAWLAALARAADEATLGAVAIDAVVDLFGADRAYFLTYRDGQLERTIVRGPDDTPDGFVDGYSTGMVGRAMLLGEPLYVADARDDEAWLGARSVMALDLRAVLCLPLATPEAILGVLYADRAAIAPVLADDDVALLASLAALAAAAIAAARARAAAHLAQGVLAALVSGLAPALPPNAVRREVLRAAIALTGADRGYWLVADGDGGYEALAALGADGEDLARAQAAISRGIADHVAAEGQPLASFDAAEDERWQDRASVQALGLRAVWCLPAGTADGALLYLDAADMAIADPGAALAALEALVRIAAPCWADPPS